jgi:hypothetical protein
LSKRKSSKAGQQSSLGRAQSKRSKKNGTQEKCLKADPLTALSSLAMLSFVHSFVHI